MLFMILTYITYGPMKWIKPSFYLSYGLLDIDLMLMNYGVVFYGLFNDVIIVFNLCLGCIRLMNLH